MQSFFHPYSQFLFYAAMMQCDGSCQLWCNIKYSLIPSFTQAPGIDKNKRGLAFFNYGYNILYELKSEMTRPGVFLYFRRNNRKHFCLLGKVCLDDRPLLVLL